MKKIIAVLIAGTFIIGTAVAQTGAPSGKPAERKEAGQLAKKDANGPRKHHDGKKHHHGGKRKGKKAETTSPEMKNQEKK